MSLAIGFARFREVQVKIDTIPKPVGLGSRGPREAVLFDGHSLNIQ
jgi:hypothetical protein